MKSRIQSHLDFNPVSEDRMLRERDSDFGGLKFGGPKARQRLVINRVDGDGTFIYIG